MNSGANTTATVVANGDLRLAANQNSWPVQESVENAVSAVIRQLGFNVQRGHGYDPEKKHGLIDSQKRGIELFRTIPCTAPLIIITTSWQYSHHLLPGLYRHKGPILTIANWSGSWPGLVGLLNLNACMRKAGIPYSSIWSVNFDDPFFMKGLAAWFETGKIHHDTSHARPLSDFALLPVAEEVGVKLAQELRNKNAVVGVFDEGCMGMYNSIVPDELLHATGIFKERLSQSALYAEMLCTTQNEALAVYDWMIQRGTRFHTGPNPDTDLTQDQVLQQCKMYISALRIADDFGCDAIGIQYQQGLKDLTAASDLAEGLMNNVERPPVTSRESNRLLYHANALPHFNEVDECSAIDALVTNRIWTALELDPESTLHDLRYGDWYTVDGRNEFVWVFQISGAAPAKHLVGGYAGAVSERQPQMYFRLGGGTLKGIGKNGEIVWSRVFIEPSGIKVDLGRGRVVELPSCESQRRWEMTTTQWPLVNAVLYGVSRDQMMARHAANHIQIAYAPDCAKADLALAAKAAMFREMGLEVFICGDTRLVVGNPHNG